MFQGTDWKTNTLKTAFHYPGIVFVVFCVLNTLIWGQKSSGAVPFGTFVALFLMWFGISVPLVFVGCASSASSHRRLSFQPQQLRCATAGGIPNNKTRPGPYAL
jgi:hypothetical protein